MRQAVDAAYVHQEMGRRQDARNQASSGATARHLEITSGGPSTDFRGSVGRMTTMDTAAAR